MNTDTEKPEREFVSLTVEVPGGMLDKLAHESGYLTDEEVDELVCLLSVEAERIMEEE